MKSILYNIQDVASHISSFTNCDEIDYYRESYFHGEARSKLFGTQPKSTPIENII